MNVERYGHGGDIWTAEELLGVDKHALLDLSANINPLGPPESVWTAIRTSLDRITAYPDVKARALRQAIAEHAAGPGQTIEWVLPGNGAAELLFAVLRALQPRRVGLLQPCFSEYEQAAHVVGADVVQVIARAEDDFLPTYNEVLDLCHRADLVVVGWPNNPNGQVLPIEWVREMATILGARGGHLLLDEAFWDFVPEVPTLATELSDWPQVILMRSMTKFYAIPGLRLGYLLAAPALIERTERQLPPWSINALAQAAGIAALADAPFAEATLRWLRTERPFLVAGLHKIPGVQVFSGLVNYVLFRTATPDLQAQLAQRGILIRSCAAYPGLGPAYYRVAVRTRAENERLLHAMQETCRDA